jgi:alkylation response protein AidB-like acyl-CoA dehydrogenase
MAANCDPAFDLPGFIEALGIVVAYGLAAADEAYREGQRYPHPQGPIGGRKHIPMTLPMPARIFTIFEGTSEIQRMLIGRAVTGLDVR